MSGLVILKEDSWNSSKNGWRIALYSLVRRALLVVGSFLQEVNVVYYYYLCEIILILLGSHMQFFISCPCPRPSALQETPTSDMLRLSW